MSTIRIVLVIFAVVMISACSHKTNVKQNLTPTAVDLSDYKVNPLLDPKLEPFEWNVSNEWGLALSGGGLRAALYSIGVLKALERGGVLKNIDILSTVSGGGYAAYWLYTDPLLPDAEFGEGRLAPQNFPVSICQLLTSGNFVTNQSVAGNLSRLSENYEDKIYRTFGPHNKNSRFKPETSIMENGFTIDSPKIPYHIVNTTDDQDGLPWKFKLFEFTPLGYGNYVLPNSMTEWRNEVSEKKTEYLKITAISGAALPFISQKVSFNSDDEIKTYELSDGGNSENLGAYALIRRGVKNIIIVDAEHNPNYEFSAYKQLKRQLADDGYEFAVPEVDEFILHQEVYKDLDQKLHKHRLFNSAFVGFVRDSDHLNKDQYLRAPYSAKIYYIKMSNSRTSDMFVHNIDEYSLDQGQRINNAVYKYIIDEAAQSQKDWDCNKINNSSVQALSEKNALESWFKYVLSSYTKAFPGFFNVKLLNAMRVDLLKSDFPQYTTFDQSYYHNQAVAFIALGYFSTLEIRPEIAKNIQLRH